MALDVTSVAFRTLDQAFGGPRGGRSGIVVWPRALRRLVTSGVIALIVALVVATAVGAAVRLFAGKVRFASRTPRPNSPSPSPVDAVPEGSRDDSPVSPAPDALTAADLGAQLGDRATLVQFSTEYCAYCGPTREALGEIAGNRAGVAVVEVDAAWRMDLAKRLRVFTTPTVLVLGPDGLVAARSSGRPRKAELEQAVRGVLRNGAGP